MKTILVDAVYCFVSDAGEIYNEMHQMLDSFDNPKIILTGANDEQFNKFGLNAMPYPVFTLKHNPEKSDPQYYLTFLEEKNLLPEEVVYFEHDQNAVKSAQSLGINTFYYDDAKKDLNALKKWLQDNL